MNTCSYLPLMAGALVFVSRLGAENLDHLEPIPPYTESGYAEGTYRELLGEGSAEGWMIGKPSFEAPYGVFIRRARKFAVGGDPFTPKLESESWTVEYAVRRWKEQQDGDEDPNPNSKPEMKTGFEVSRSVVKVSKEFAEAVLNSWESLLRDTRYSKELSWGLDGEWFEFYCAYNLFGSTWSPSSGRPKIMTDLGAELGELARSGEAARDAHVRRCLELAAKLKAAGKKD